MYDIYTTKNKSAGFVGECQIDKYTISDALIIIAYDKKYVDIKTYKKCLRDCVFSELYTFSGKRYNTVT